jgi:hypothetical protein
LVKEVKQSGAAKRWHHFTRARLLANVPDKLLIHVPILAILNEHVLTFCSHLLIKKLAVALPQIHILLSIYGLS